ncbi:MAG: phosphatase PAP2 family protein [Patescibacteria group bacterium]|nr:phosphatase PAP2 family protein [Patescibacteria group bacterium]MDE2438314.1 phosphatase PAP2 family protein [Patescibacteria group bacterium]
MYSDIAIVEYLNGFVNRTSFMNALLVFITNDLGYLLIIGALWYSYQSYKKGEGIRAFLFLSLSALLSRLIITEGIRLVWHRPRPFLAISSLHLIIPPPLSASFPSGHAAFYGALAGGMYVLHRKIGAWYFVFAASIALSRVVLGVHYMSDIIAGGVVAWISVVCMKHAWYSESSRV